MDNHLNEDRKQLYLRILVRAIITFLIFWSAVYIVPRTFPLIAPFFYAFLLATALNPLILKLNERLKWSRRVLSLVLVILVIAILLSVIGWLGYIIVNELILLANDLDAIWDAFLEATAFVGYITRTFLDFLPGDTDVFFNNFTDNIFDWVNTSIVNLGNYLLARAPELTTRIGSGVLDVIMFVLGSYFITAEYPRFQQIAKKHSDGSVYKHYLMVKNAAKIALGGYLKAQLILSGIVFAIAFPSLLIIGQEYAFLLALLLAFIDFIPLVGTSIVLVPWGLVQIISGNIVIGVFLILLSWVYFFMRRIMEPKVMGAQTGLHPLLAILSIYVGLRAYGVWGAILGPIVVMIAMNLIEAKVFESARRDVKKALHDVKRILIVD